MSSASFWDTTWNRPYGRYNKHHQEIYRAMLPYLKGKIADIGCGPCLMWQGQDVDLVGVDQSAIAIREARKNYPKGNFFVADATCTGLPSGEFDTVVMFGLLDYFEDWTSVLQEAERIKTTNGRIFATLLNGFRRHDWTRYPHITGNWHLYEDKHNRYALGDELFSLNGHA